MIGGCSHPVRAGYCLSLAALLVMVGCEGLQNATANGDTRSIAFHNTHTKENLTVTSAAALTPPGTRILVRDGFQATNNFHGGQLGVEARYGDTFFVDVAAKVALGCSDREVTISGSTRSTVSFRHSVSGTWPGASAA